MAADLWPVFTPPTGVKAPVYVLKEQATLLSSKTQKIVRGFVQSIPSGGRSFAYLLELSSPALPGYSFNLLTLSYPLDFYPLSLTAFDETHIANDEGEFRDMLARVFQDPRTKQIVEAIMAQALAMKEK
jgi:hypothetical protein